MENPEEVKKMMSHDEVIKRFKKVFGRDMTAAERNAFFLTEKTPPKKAKG
jgi:hypothetical protein